MSSNGLSYPRYQPNVPSVALDIIFDTSVQAAVDLKTGGDGDYSFISNGLVSSYDVELANLAAGANSADIDADGLTVESSGATVFIRFKVNRIYAADPSDSLLWLVYFSGTISGSGKRFVAQFENSAGTYHAGIQYRNNGTGNTIWVERRNNGTNTHTQTGAVAGVDALGLISSYASARTFYGTWSNPRPSFGSLTEDSSLAFDLAPATSWPFDRSTDQLELQLNHGSGNVLSIKRVVALRALVGV